MNRYLIPANSKKSMLIFGLFTKPDLILFGVGMGVSLLLLLILPVDIWYFAIIAVLPGIISGFLVFPFPNYHNILTIIKEIINFYSSRQCYVWRGWCLSDEQKDDQKQVYKRWYSCKEYYQWYDYLRKQPKSNRC